MIHIAIGIESKSEIGNGANKKALFSRRHYCKATIFSHAMANLNDDDDDDELGLSRIEIVSAQQRNCYFQKVVKEWQNKRAIIIIIIVFS